MNLNNVLKSIKNIHDYTSASQNDELNVIQKKRMLLNKSAISAFKKVQGFEVEYFKKFGENGFACIAFTHILEVNATKKWSVYGIELVAVLKFWLDSIQKDLIKHNPLWWSFLEVILYFIKAIYIKHSTIQNTLLEQTAECLLDLATQPRSNEFQKSEILHCLKTYSANSSRKIRLFMKEKFTFYLFLLKSLDSDGTFYENIEKKYKKYLFRPHNLRSDSNVHRLKETIEDIKKILIDLKTMNYDVFEFPNDSENEDVIAMPIPVLKRKSVITTQGSEVNNKLAKIGYQQVNYKENIPKASLVND